MLSIGDGRITQQPTVIIDAILHGFGGQIGQQPGVIVTPIISHPAVLPKRFTEKNSALVIDVKGDDVGYHRFRRKQIDRPTLFHRDRLHGLFGFAGSLCHFWFERFSCGRFHPNRKRI